MCGLSKERVSKSKFQIDDRVTDGIQRGKVTGHPIDGWVRVYWDSTGDLHHETVQEKDIELWSSRV